MDFKYSNLLSFINYQRNLYNKTFDKDENNNIKEHFLTETFTSIKNVISLLMYLAFVFVAGYLAWKCNVEYTTGMRVFITIVAGLFGPWYLLYYAFYHNVLSNNCTHGLIEQQTLTNVSNSVKTAASNIGTKLKMTGGDISSSMPDFLSSDL